jgi:hypothetical protein
MSFRFVTKTVHAYLDYPIAICLMATPFILGLDKANPIALWLSVATGIAAFALTFLTDHETGVIHVLPYRFHVVDRAVGFVFMTAPFVLGFGGLDAVYYGASGAAVLLVTYVLDASETDAGAMVPARA